MSDLSIDTTDIPGLLVLHLPLHGDNRGWFKENWQREKMTALGLPDFGPVQNNVSHNAQAGVTRGMHAEPWDKLVSVATGRILGAWVDLRDGNSFGNVVTVEMGPETAVFVPRGVANGYQALEDGTTYTYLVNDHWSAEAKKSYTFVNLADPALGINWPICVDQAELSEADRHHPPLSGVIPFRKPRTVVLGSNGQLGKALRPLLPDAEFTTRETLDLSNPASLGTFDWSGVGTIITAYPRHYVLRTSWVVGEGNNFVNTMASLARRGISPQVVSDQHGRLTFTRDLAAAIIHLLTTGAPFGSYNISNEGPTQTWFDIANEIFTLLGADGTVTPTTAAEWGKGKDLAPRPEHSTLDLSRIEASGFTPATTAHRLREHLGVTK